MADRSERGIIFRIIGLGRQNSQDQEKQLHEAHQLSARVTQLGANASSAQEKLGSEFEAFIAGLSNPEDRAVMESIILAGLELEGIYCSLALIDIAIKEGLPPSTILHLVDGLREKAMPRPGNLKRT